MIAPSSESCPPVLFVNSIKFWGGGEQWFLQTAETLASRGYDVCVAGRRHGIFMERIRAVGLNTLPLRMASDFSLPDYFKLRHWLMAHPNARVLCNLSRDIRIAGAATRSCQSAKVFWIMGSILVRNRWRDRFWMRRFVDQIVVPSHALAGELGSLGFIAAEKITVLPIGLDLRKWNSDVRETPAGLDPVERGETRPTVGVFGRLETRKGHAVLLKAWTQIREVVPDVRLWIVGAGREEAALKQLAQPIGDSVRFWGHQSDIRPIMQLVDVVVQPSLYEPFGITLIEAMATAKPIVCTNVGGIPEVVDEHTAEIVPPHDPESLARAVTGLLTEAERARAMGAAGRQRAAQHFSLELMINRFESLIRGDR